MFEPPISQDARKMALRLAELGVSERQIRLAIGYSEHAWQEAELANEVRAKRADSLYRIMGKLQERAEADGNIRAIEVWLKANGYMTERVEHSGPDGGSIMMGISAPRPETIEEWTKRTQHIESSRPQALPPPLSTRPTDSES